MPEIVSGSDPAPQKPEVGHDAICLRCDWTGETDSETCPRCEARVYRPWGSAEPLEADPSGPQPHSAERIPSSAGEAPRADDNLPRAVPVALSRRTWLIVGALALAALWIVASRFDRHQAPSVSSTASSAGVPSASTAGGQSASIPVGHSAAGRKPAPKVTLIGDVTSTPVRSPDGNRIAFGARGGTLYLMDLRSDKPSLVVQLPGKNLDSVDEIEWSPDGAHLAIMNDLEPGGGRLYLMNADGSGIRVIRENYKAGGLAWSPDGSQLAFAESTGGRRSWYVVDAHGASPPRAIDEQTYLSWRGSE